MAYRDETTRRLYVSESPLLADDTNYQFVSSDVDDDTETARVNAMQAAYEDLRLRGADVESGVGGGHDDELEAEARYQEALRERLGKPPPQPQRRQQQQPPPPPQPQRHQPSAAPAGSSVAAAAARRYGVPKLDLRDSVDESRSYDEYAAVEDSLDFETPRAAAGGTAPAATWSDPPPNPFAHSAAAPPHAGNLAKPTPAERTAPVAAAAEPPRQAQQKQDNDELSRPPLRPVAPPVGADAFAYGNLQPPRAQQQPHPTGQPGLLGQLADDPERAWRYRQSPPPVPQNLQWHAPTAYTAPLDNDGDLNRRPAAPGAAGERHSRPPLGAAAASASTADGGGAAGSVDGIRHLPPKPLRPAPNFVELNKSRALAKDASPKGSYVERISKKKEVSEMLRDLAPGQRMPRRKAASADDVSASAAPTAAAAAGQAPTREQAVAPSAAVVDDAQAAELWRQRASGLSTTKGPKNSRGAGAAGAGAAAAGAAVPAGALHRRSSDSNINRPPHFVQPLPLAPKDFKPGERDLARAADVDAGGGGYLTAPFDSDASASNRLQSVVGPPAPAAPATLAYADVLYRPPPEYYHPPLLALPHGYGGGFAGPYPATGYGPYFLGAPPPHVHPAFSLAQQDARTSAALSGGVAFGTRQPPAAFFHGPPPPLPPSQFGPSAEQPQVAPYGGAYSSLPDLDALQLAEAGLALTLPPPPPPQAWSGRDVGSAAAATAVPPPPQLHAQLDAAGAGRLTHYATVPPIRTAPAATDGGSGSSYTQQYVQLREKEKRRGENPSYTAYTLSDYRKLEKEIKLGGLGPSLDPLTLREKNERRLRQLQYAKQAVEQQRAALETQKISKQLQQQQPSKQRAAIGGKGEEWEPGASSTPTQERQLDAASADEALSRRQAAMEYARSVPKPKVKARPKPNDSLSATSASTQRDGRSSSAGLPLSDRERTPTVTAALVPLSKLGDTDLQMLHQRHQLEKMAVMELRKNARAAV